MNSDSIIKEKDLTVIIMILARQLSKTVESSV